MIGELINWTVARTSLSYLLVLSVFLLFPLVNTSDMASTARVLRTSPVFVEH